MEVTDQDFSGPTRVFLVRHGETAYNRGRIMQGRRINASLNARGRAQAEALGERFSDIRLDAIYASSLRRAIETATAISDRQPESTSVRCRTAFDEMCWGRYEGRGSSPDLQNMLDHVFGEWGDGNFAYQIEGGESILEVQKRAVAGFQEVIARHQGQTILIASHGRLLRVLLASLLPEYGLSRMNDIRHHNTCVNELLVERGACRAVTLNCVRHLSAYLTAA